ncbi:hypothetical protein [Acidocella sp.]|jgi:hypothetical protein|uniref:hypothetical protein n=1 Tax=Acidocella sp. TaxID=50710 RepID=UPI002F3F7132
MSITSKFLPALALAVALSPVAAYAHSNAQGGQAQAYQAAQANAVTPSSATIDNPTPVYSNHAFPDSFGG